MKDDAIRKRLAQWVKLPKRDEMSRAENHLKNRKPFRGRHILLCDILKMILHRTDDKITKRLIYIATWQGMRITQKLKWYKKNFK